MDLEEVNSLVKAEEQWRKRECINLIASENVTSPAVDAAYASDFSHRYAEGEPFKRYYNGTRYIDELEQKTTELAKQVLRARDVDLRPISGTVANIAAFAFLVKPGSLVLSNATAAGGHISHNSRGAVGLVGGKPVAFPVAEDYFHLDVDKTIALIEEKSKSENQAERISTLVFGCSLFLFPQPIREIAPAAKASGCRVAFDAAHVLGLVAAGLFQDPLREGAELMTSSTHKTFFGPQGGLIASELSDEEWSKCKSRVFPGVTSNHHLHRIPALAVALLEFQKFGVDYAKQIVANAKAFAQALSEAGFEVCGEEFNFTESHQVAVDVSALGGGLPVANALEENNIIANKNLLPWDKISLATLENPSGVRLGVQEMTRWGCKEGEFQEIAGLFKKAVLEKKNVKGEVIEFKRRFQKIGYCF